MILKKQLTLKRILVHITFILCGFCLVFVQNINAQQEEGSQNATNSTQEIDLKKNLSDKLNSVSNKINTATGQDPLALALKTIELSMGEKGFELWRLKAEWASVKASDGSIKVVNPKILYFMNKNYQEEKQKFEQALIDEQLKLQNSTTTQSKDNIETNSTQRTEPTQSDVAEKVWRDLASTSKNMVFVTADSGIVNQKEKSIRLEGNVLAMNADKQVSGPLMFYNGETKTITFPDGVDFIGSNVTAHGKTGTWDLANNVISAEGGVSLSSDAPLVVTDKKIVEPEPIVSSTNKTVTPQPSVKRIKKSPTKKSTTNKSKKSSKKTTPKSAKKPVK